MLLQPVLPGNSNANGLGVQYSNSRTAVLAVGLFAISSLIICKNKNLYVFIHLKGLLNLITFTSDNDE